MRITWRGHAFFEIEARNGTTILVDPLVENGKTAKDLAYFRGLGPDTVLVTHGHFDHLGQAREIGAHVVSIYEIATALGNAGLETTGMNIGGTVERHGVHITMTNAVHSSGMPGKGDELAIGGNPAGFIIDDGATRLYHAGDTALFGDMKTVIRDIHKPDVALLPIGDLFTMGPQHAAVAAKWLGVKHVIPMHYNTFPPIEQDPQELVKGVGAAAKVHVLDVDGAMDL